MSVSAPADRFAPTITRCYAGAAKDDRDQTCLAAQVVKRMRTAGVDEG